MAAAILCLTGWSGVRVWKKLNVRLLKHESAGHYRRFHAFKLFKQNDYLGSYFAGMISMITVLL
jgi:hypothetical protein